MKQTDMSVIVFNSLSRSRTAAITLLIDRARDVCVTDEHDNPVVHQV